MITCGVIYFKFVEIESYRVLDKIVLFGIPYYVYYIYSLGFVKTELYCWIA